MKPDHPAVRRRVIFERSGYPVEQSPATAGNDSHLEKLMSVPPQQPGGYGPPPDPQGEPTYQSPSQPPSQAPNPPPTTWSQPAPPETAPPAKRRSTATAVLAVLTVLLLLALAGMVALYLSEKDDSDKQIADQKAQIENLESDLKAKNDEAAEADKELESTEACIKAVQEFFKALNANDEVATGRAALTIDRDCEGVDIKF